MSARAPFPVLGRTVVYDGRILRLVVERVEEVPGRPVEREIVEHRGAAVVVPLHRNGDVVLVRQYRHAVRAFLWELPAGHLDEGERPEEAAHRELAEETGYRAGRIEPLTEILPAPGYTTERMHLFLATDLEPGPARPDEDETIEVRRFAFDDALAVAGEGGRWDAKTLVGLLLARTRAGRP